jgi:cobalt-zinc-cadmium efflux system protein
MMHRAGHEAHEGGSIALREQSRRALSVALAITLTFAVVEAIGGFFAGSLALLADAGHMVIDVLAIGLSLFAAWVAGRPTNPRKTFGYQRAEVLAALVNGGVLVAVGVWIAWEAVTRLSHPPAVESGLMLAVAFAGLAANGTSMLVLLRLSRSSLNVRAALLDKLGDTLGVAGTIVAGAVIVFTGWQRADPVASLVIAGLILFSSWNLLRETVDVLLEGTPAGIDMTALERAMLAVPGVSSVHDIHVWTVTSGFVSMSGHVELNGTSDAHTVLDALTETLRRRFGIGHVTIQPETTSHAADCCEVVCEVPTAGGQDVGEKSKAAS